LFAVTGEPVDVDIEVKSPCNRNGICEPESGESEENCPDCFPKEKRCTPSEKFCVSDYLFICNDDGSAYSFEYCLYGCSDGGCVLPVAGTTTGMAVATDPVFIFVVVILAAVIVYMLVLVKRMRREMQKAEKRKISYEDVKAITKGEK
jgi:uncharacterized membrane protein